MFVRRRLTRIFHHQDQDLAQNSVIYHEAHIINYTHHSSYYTHVGGDEGGILFVVYSLVLPVAAMAIREGRRKAKNLVPTHPTVMKACVATCTEYRITKRAWQGGASLWDTEL